MPRYEDTAITDIILSIVCCLISSYSAEALQQVRSIAKLYAHLHKMMRVSSLSSPSIFPSLPPSPRLSRLFFLPFKRVEPYTYNFPSLLVAGSCRSLPPSLRCGVLLPGFHLGGILRDVTPKRDPPPTRWQRVHAGSHSSLGHVQSCQWRHSYRLQS